MEVYSGITEIMAVAPGDNFGVPGIRLKMGPKEGLITDTSVEALRTGRATIKVNGIELETSVASLPIGEALARFSK